MNKSYGNSIDPKYMNSNPTQPDNLSNLKLPQAVKPKEGAPPQRLLRRPLFHLLKLAGLAGTLVWAACPAGAATLDVMDGLTMRLEAIDGVLTDDAGYVTDWTDLTGNGHDASQNVNPDRRPLLVPTALPSGVPALRFDGNNDLMTLAGQVVSSQDFSIFAVVNATPQNSGNKNLFGNWAPGNMTSSLFIGLTGYQSDTDSAKVRFTDVYQVAGIVPHVGRYFMLDFVTDNDPGGPGAAAVTYDWITLLTGQDLDTPGSRNLTSNPDTDPYVIGVQGDPDHGGSAGEYWAGDIAALLVYDRALSAAEQAQVRQYLQDTYLEPVPPTIESTQPAADAILANLRSITVMFDEAVKNVDAADLLINGAAVATNVIVVSPREYTFQFPQVAPGEVTVSFAANHGITDLASSPNAFAETPWHYIRVEDPTPPTVEIMEPAAGAIVSGLNFITVVFSEGVAGVDLGDLLINGSPLATNLTVTSPSTYTFSFPEPPPGSVTVAFAPNHGIKDLAAIPNLFAGRTWSYTLDLAAPISLVVQRGLAMRLESTMGVTNDESGLVSGWADQSGNGHDAFQQNPDRQPLLVADATLTGAPVLRFDGGSDLFTLAGQVVSSQDFSIFAVVNATPSSTGNKNLFGNWSAAVGRFGTALYLGLTGYQAGSDSATVRFTDVASSAGMASNVKEHFLLDFITDNDLTGAGSAAVAYNGATIYAGEDLDAQGGRDLKANPDNAPYVIGVQGDPDHGVSAGEYWQGDIAAFLVYDRFLSPAELKSVRQYLIETYVSQDNAAPTLVSTTPPADVMPKELGSITVLFSEDVMNVDAGDLLVNGVPATNVVAASPRQYTFQFPQPAPGNVDIAFAPAQDITDMARVRNPFEGGTWAYTLDPGAVYAVIPDGLVMQLEAISGVTADADGKVSGWTDQTGNGHDAFQANAERQPVLVPGATPAGAPALRFDGTSDLLTLSGQVISSQDFSIFAVVKATPTDGGNKNLFGNWSGAVGNFGDSVFIGLSGYQSGTDSAVARFTDFHVNAGRVAPVGHHFLLDFWTHSDAGANASAVFFNSVLLYTGNALGTRNLTSNPDTAPYLIGAQGDPDHGWTAGEYWTGDVSALLVYDRYLDTAEQFEVRQYLYYTYLAPAAAPSLTIKQAAMPGGAGVRISWPQATGAGFTLQSSTALPAAAWVDVTPVETEGDEFVANESLAGSPTGAKFYRLLKR